MKSLAEQMAVYTAYHRNPWNRLTHFFGVPLIIFSVLIPLSWPRIGVGGLQISLGLLIVLALLVYYLMLDWRLGLVMALVLGVILYCSHWVAISFSANAGWIVFVIAFVGGWVLQLLGHVFEGRRPALVDNVWQIFIAPIFLVAELFFACGARSDLQKAVQAKSGSENNFF